MLNFFKLPYDLNSFGDMISPETLDFHYNKHHKTYFDNLIKLISGTELENKDLLDIIIKSFNQDNLKSVFNNSAQVFNHDFYWQSLSPKKIIPSDFIKSEINNFFSSWEEFATEFKKTALTHFASGWAWVVLDNDDKKIKIISTVNAENPLIHNQIPLICVDVWEHAYYIDYRNKRSDYLNAVIDNLINWNFFEENLKKGLSN